MVIEEFFEIDESYLDEIAELYRSAFKGVLCLFVKDWDSDDKRCLIASLQRYLDLSAISSKFYNAHM